MSKSTTVVTSTTHLSKLADKLLSDIAKADKGRPMTKSQLLNTFAAAITGSDHNWGFLTGSDIPVVQQGLPKQRLNDLLEIIPAGARKAKDEINCKIILEAAPEAPSLTLHYLEGLDQTIDDAENGDILQASDILWLNEQLLEDPDRSNLHVDRERIKIDISDTGVKVVAQDYEPAYVGEMEFAKFATMLKDLLPAATRKALSDHHAPGVIAELINAYEIIAQEDTLSEACEEYGISDEQMELAIQQSALIAFIRLDSNSSPLEDILKFNGALAIQNLVIDGDIWNLLYTMLGIEP